MKHVRMLGLLAAAVVSMSAGCRSDDDPVKEPSNNLGTGGAGGSGGVSGTGGATHVGGTFGTDKDASSSTTDADSSTVDTVPEIAGTYFDGFQPHQIAEGFWRIDTSVFHITVLDNTRNFLIASNDPSNQWDPGKWSRFDWTRVTNGDLYYCQTAYMADTQQLAEDTAPANALDLAHGCATFSWSKLSPISGADAGS